MKNRLTDDQINDLYVNLVDSCLNLINSEMESTPIGTYIDDIQNIINQLFVDYTCTEIFYTRNTDTPCFGIYVSPYIDNGAALKILTSEENTVVFDRYKIEIDARICTKLNPEELAAYLIEDISTTMSKAALDNVRAIIDEAIASEDSYINIKTSVNYTQLFIFAIKDTLRKTTSLIYKNPDTYGINDYSRILDIHEDIDTCASKIRSIIFGEDFYDAEEPKLSILNWVFIVYNDLSTNYNSMKDTLEEAKMFTGSVIEKFEIDKTLACIRRAMNEVIGEAEIAENNTLFLEGLFKSLKHSGLRGIEDDLFEFKIRIKNCTDEEEAIYILRQINTRISILEEYIASNDLKENELRRWRDLIEMFRMLRVEISKKKIGQKNYGVFVDYDQFDQYD